MKQPATVQEIMTNYPIFSADKVKHISTDIVRIIAKEIVGKNVIICSEDWQQSKRLALMMQSYREGNGCIPVTDYKI